MNVKEEDTCPECSGTGFWIGLTLRYTCDACDGTGKRRRDDNIDVEESNDVIDDDDDKDTQPIQLDIFDLHDEYDD